MARLSKSPLSFRSLAQLLSALRITFSLSRSLSSCCSLKTGKNVLKNLLPSVSIFASSNEINQSA
jgi:hypothetical protein